MTLFIDQLLNGVVSGAIYACLALALVLTYRATNVVNFAQGEIAMFSAFVTWQLVQFGLPVWIAIPLTILFAFIGGAVLERVFIRPVAKADELTVVLLTVALLFIFNQGAGFIWGFMVKSFPAYAPAGNYTLAGLSVPWHLAVSIGAILLIIGGMHFLFRHTRLGLAMRVAAGNPETSRLVGISPNSMRLIGWALAGAIGAIAAILASPIYFLSPSLMTTVLIYAFAAATLGGFDSPGGAIIGGLVMGIGENLAVTYISWLGSDLKVVVPLVTIVLVLMIRPTGLFGHTKIVRA